MLRVLFYVSALAHIFAKAVSMDPPFIADNITAELFGTELKSIVSLEKVIEALALLPGDFEYKKYALIVILDRRGVKLERWMVNMLRGA